MKLRQERGWLKRVGLDRQCRGLGGLDIRRISKNSYGAEDTDGHTIGQVCLLIHQSITEHALLNVCS